MTYHACIQISALLEQWLIEGKFSHKETLMMASQMLAGGIDTVSLQECNVSLCAHTLSIILNENVLFTHFLN